MRKRLTQLNALSCQEWQILLSSLVLLPLIALALHIKGFKWTRSYLQARLKKQLPEAPDSPPSAKTPPLPSNKNLPAAQAVARMLVLAANHGPYRANCLKRSMVLWYLLQRRGIPAQLHIGVDRSRALKEDHVASTRRDKASQIKTTLKAHAWIEYADTRLGEPDYINEQYSSFGPQ